MYIWCFIDVNYSFTYTARGILNGLICVVHFSNNFIVYSMKKVNKTCWYSGSIAYKEKRTDWILRIFTFNDKNPLYLPLILTLQLVLKVKVIKE